jgi:hypothetical protein
MYLDPREFEYMLKLRPGLNWKKYRTAIKYDGNSIILRLVDVRTYGGVIRFSLDSEGKSLSTGSTTTPVRIHDPYRLSESSAYVMYFHLALRGDLPKDSQIKDVVMEIMPTLELSEAGLTFGRSLFRGGVENNLQVTAFTHRRMEIFEDYPVAWLRFLGESHLESIPELKDDDGKNTSSQSE